MSFAGNFHGMQRNGAGEQESEKGNTERLQGHGSVPYAKSLGKLVLPGLEDVP